MSQIGTKEIWHKLPVVLRSFPQLINRINLFSRYYVTVISTIQSQFIFEQSSSRIIEDFIPYLILWITSLNEPRRLTRSRGSLIPGSKEVALVNAKIIKSSAIRVDDKIGHRRTLPSRDDRQIGRSRGGGCAGGDNRFDPLPNSIHLAKYTSESGNRARCIATRGVAADYHLGLISPT